MKAQIIKESETRTVVVSNNGVVLAIKKSIDEAKAYIAKFATN